MGNQDRRDDNVYYSEYYNMNGTSYSGNNAYDNSRSHSNNYENNQYGNNNYYADSLSSEEAQSKIMTKSFLVVLAALIITAFVATLTAYNTSLTETISSSLYVWMIIEVAVVIGASFAIRKKNTVLAAVLFGAYAVVNGLTLSFIFYVYDLGSIQEVFLLTAIMFAGMAVIGATTHINLTKFGSILMMGLWGIILVTVANLLFLHSSGLYLLMDYVGIVIFVGLTAYDTYKMKLMARNSSAEDANIIALYCGMELYLDFINLFLRLLSIFAKNRD